MAGKNMSEAALDLGKRHDPIQARAIQSRAHILEVAGALLEDVGLDAFNTNLLAERADVRVRTIYRYFPNKFAVIAALGEKLVNKWADRNASSYVGIGAPGGNWEAILATMIDTWFTNVTEARGGWAVLQAMNAIPELREVDREAFQLIAASWEKAIRSRAPNFEGDAAALSCAIVSTIYGFIDSYLRLPESVRHGMPHELLTMLSNRLRPVFEH